jgi:LysM repeat protein
MVRSGGRLIVWVGGLAWAIIVGVILFLAITDPTFIDPSALGFQLARKPTVTGIQVTPVVATFTALPTIAVPVTPTLAPTVTESPTATFTALPTQPPPTQVALVVTGVPVLPTTDPVPATAAIPITPTVTLPPTDAPTKPASGCTPPSGWVTYTVTTGDSLFGFQLGSQNTVTVDQIISANCLKSRFVNVGQLIYLPPGVAANAPKIDDSPGGSAGVLPAGAKRVAACPCKITVRSGWRREQIAAAVDQAKVRFTGGDYLAVTGANAAVNFSFLADKPAGASLEGFLFPGTYTLDNQSSAQSFRDMQLRAFDSAVNGTLRADATKRGLSFYQTITLASIVQRESYAPVEQVKVASVMYNRMAKGMTLSATVTVQYMIGRSGAWWPTVKGSDLKNQNKYNTYIWKGVTPGPISNPDLGTITSTIYPAETPYLFFNGSCDGPGNYYAVTYAEFEAYLKKCGVLK